MNSGDAVQTLFQLASDYKFDAFEQLLQEMAAEKTVDSPDVHLLAAQIKLFSADETLMEHLQNASRVGGAATLPCLSTVWQPDGPNRFVVFPREIDGLGRLLRLLSRAEEEMHHWYGEVGSRMVRQVWGEILYFRGELEQAIALAEENLKKIPPCGPDTVLPLYVMFRCYLAMGQPEKAERCMLDMIRGAQAEPGCAGPYTIVRDWANMTTGWSGDAPRFQYSSGGESQPVLEERLVAIRKGISQLTAREEPFAAYAGHHYQSAYTMRQHYMDIFNAIYWFQMEDYAQTETFFHQAYQTAGDSGLVMPFVEYGKQMIPLLEHIGNSGVGYAPDWIQKMLTMSEQYEQSIQAYRS